MRQILSQQQLDEGVTRLAQFIDCSKSAPPLTIIGVLNGSIVLVADLIRRLEGPLRIALVWASSYRGDAITAGNLELRMDVLPDLKDQDVLVVDDIFDTGHTLQTIIKEISTYNPIRIRTLVLLKKHGKSQVSIAPDFIGFEIPDEFVVGYGLDFNGLWRHLPYLAALDPEDRVEDKVAIVPAVRRVENDLSISEPEE